MRARRFAAVAIRWWLPAVLPPLAVVALGLADVPAQGLSVLSGTFPVGPFPELIALLGLAYVAAWLLAILVSPALALAGLVHGAHAATRAHVSPQAR